MQAAADFVVVSRRDVGVPLGFHERFQGLVRSEPDGRVEDRIVSLVGKGGGKGNGGITVVSQLLRGVEIEANVSQAPPLILRELALSTSSALCFDPITQGCDILWNIYVPVLLPGGTKSDNYLC